MSATRPVDTPPSPDALEDRVQAIGRDLWDRVEKHANSGFFENRLIEPALADESFRFDLFRFVDVLPALPDDVSIAQHVREYLIKEGRELPAAMQAGLRIAGGRLTGGIAAKVMRRLVSDLAGRFIASDSPEGALKPLRKLHEGGIGMTVDLLGEATLSEAEAKRYSSRYEALIDTLAGAVSEWPASASVDSHPRANVSVKVSALCPNLTHLAPDASAEDAISRLRPLIERAKAKNVFVYFDAEQWTLNEVILRTFEGLATLPEFADYPHLGVVVQAYLKSSNATAGRLIDLAERRDAPFSVRLVKGAYWDYELMRSRQHGYPCPVFATKGETDAHYETLAKRLIDASPNIEPAFGTHNVRSMAFALAYAEERGLKKDAYEFQSLYGMAGEERAAQRELDCRVRVYAPLGEMLPGMAYLVRRLLENTSNQGFLRLSRETGADVEALLRRPTANTPPQRANREFSNAPWIEFMEPTNRDRFAQAVEETSQKLPITVAPVISGRNARTSETLERESPNDTARLVANVGLASEEDVSKAVDAASAAFERWSQRRVQERAHLLRKFGTLLDARRIEIAALQVHEEAKPWIEADADVAEAIDFCNFYAWRAEHELTGADVAHAAGERNAMVYQGRGPSVVIAPWNFPAAILCGMTTAALVAGNTAIMKPAEQSSAVGQALFRLMLEAGFPEDVVHFLPGRGETVGTALVAHPKVAQIAFTGSVPVGQAILQSAATPRPGQFRVKHVVCEMGGKNAIVIDESADLDDAVAGCLRSAFGYAGQKCSAASRIIVLDRVYDAFVERFTSAAASLRVRSAVDPECDVPPVIDEESFSRLRDTIKRFDAKLERLYAGEAPEGGYYIAPHVYACNDPEHRIMQDELFGPVVAVYRAKDLDDALVVANNTTYALTGGFYSRTPSHLERARREFEVGNLYLNRGTTGAIVNRQPFGGHRLSGGGTKAGGPGYLLNFADPKAITENTARHGFSPDVSA